MLTCVRVRVHGRVQGVGFRDWARRTAAAIGVVGFVRNLPDGGVEAVVEGPEELVDRMVAELQRGPSPARVLEAHIERRPVGNFKDFIVAY